MKLSTSKKLTSLLLLVSVLISIQSCQRLDNNFFNPTKTKKYLKDNYVGEKDFELDTTYKIPKGMEYDFFLYSKTKNERAEIYINATYIGPLATINRDTVIIYFHGNKGNMDFYWNRAKLLAFLAGKLNYGVLTFDYRGYGLSKGISSEETIYADAEAAMRWLKSKNVNPKKVILYGFSLGAVPAIKMMAESESFSPEKLIVEAPFASSSSLVQSSSKINMPSSYFTDIRMNNAEKIKSVTQPLLWIHGKNDTFIDYKVNGQLVYDNHKGSYKEAQLIEGADHSDVITTMGIDNYKKALLSYIRRK
jgi:pimeloyl-ACP methyl ester carboxylesterase